MSASALVRAVWLVSVSDWEGLGVVVTKNCGLNVVLVHFGASKNHTMATYARTVPTPGTKHNKFAKRTWP